MLHAEPVHAAKPTTFVCGMTIFNASQERQRLWVGEMKVQGVYTFPSKGLVNHIA